MKNSFRMNYILDLFDKYFVHFFISCLHLFFIFMGLWLARYDLAVVGIVFLVISLFSFEYVQRYGTEPVTDQKDEIN